MRDEANGIITFKGKVVYDRKKHYIKGKDVHRFTRSVQLPEDKVQAEALVLSISLIVGVLYSINDFELKEIVDFSLASLVRANDMLTELVELWSDIQVNSGGGLFGGGGASGTF